MNKRTVNKRNYRKKKTLKKLSFILALLLIAALVYFSNALLGNPYSKNKANKSAKNYLETKYPNTDLYIEDLRYIFKFGEYYAYIESPSSIDSEFTITIDKNGNIKGDDYESRVIEKENTSRRLDDEYRQIVDKALDSSDCPYQINIGFGGLEIYPRKIMNNANISSYAVAQEDLELDKQYDISELGANIGKIVVYIENETVNIETVSKMILDLKNYLDKCGVTFYSIDFELKYPKNDKGTQSKEYIGVKKFLYKDIYEDGMQQRVEKSYKELKDYYNNLDK